MSTIEVALGPRRYPVAVLEDARAALARRVAELAPTRVVAVTDENVAREEVPRLGRAGLALPHVVAIPPGEGSKTIATVERLWRAFLAAGLDRKGLVLAVGGGVVGDVAGFAAATFLRGVAVVHAPTSLVAMVDSAVGGKTGVNLEGKNLVGAFHQPSGVFASVGALASLPDRELRAGLGEVAKTALLSGEDLLARVERDAARLLSKDVPALLPVVSACVRLKAGIVERDEREDGERALLNLGHTLGHALETLDGPGGLLHGEAVAIGLVFAARLSARLGRCRRELVERVEALVARLGLPARPARVHAPPEVLELMRRDKKARGGRLRFVLPVEVGRSVVADDVPDAAVVEELLAFAG